MSFNEALKSGSAHFKRNFGSMFATGVVSYVFVFGVLFGTARLILALAPPPKPFDPTAYWHSLATPYQVCWVLGSVLLAWTAQLMAHAGAAWIALRETKGEQGSAWDAVKAVFARLPSLIVLAMLIAVPTFIGGILLIIPGLFVSAIGLMIVPEMIIRNLSLRSAIGSGVRIGLKHVRPVGLVLVLFAAAWLVIWLAIFLAPGTLSPLFGLAVFLLLEGLLSSWVGAILSSICIEYHRLRPA